MPDAHINGNNNGNVLMNTENKLKNYIDNQQWSKARTLLLKELKKEPESHWYLTMLSFVLCQLGKYNEALGISQKAIEIAPNCPVVIFDMVGVYLDLEDYDKAIYLCKRLLRRNLKAMAYGECGEGLRWAKSLKNDCRYDLAISYYNKGKYIYAMRYMKKHIENRSPGLPSINDLRKVKKEYRIMKKHANKI